jgi:hypothetical protein
MHHLQVKTRNSPERQKSAATLPIRPNFSLALSRFKADKIPPFPDIGARIHCMGLLFQLPTCYDQTHEYESMVKKKTN